MKIPHFYSFSIKTLGYMANPEQNIEMKTFINFLMKFQPKLDGFQPVK